MFDKPTNLETSEPVRKKLSLPMVKKDILHAECLFNVD